MGSGVLFLRPGRRVLVAVGVLLAVGLVAAGGPIERLAPPRAAAPSSSPPPMTQPPPVPSTPDGGAAGGAETEPGITQVVPVPGCPPTSSTASQAIAWRNPMLIEHVPVLMYHRVVPLSEAGDSLPSLVVSPQRFAAQMAALHAAGWHSITFRQLAIDLAAGRREPPRTLVITFDDGYADGYRYVFPVLQRYGFVATYFVVTGRVGEPAYLSAGELCALTEAGDEIANHTVHHIGLATVPPARAVAEIAQAGRMIAAWTGVPPITLAYPFGDWSPTVVAILRRYGYWLAATTVPGATESFANRLLVPRLRVGPATTPAALVAMVRAYRGG